jgi:hypothetical protein
MKILKWHQSINNFTKEMLGRKISFIEVPVPSQESERSYIYNIRTLSVNIKFICTSFRNRQNSRKTCQI